jgi:hypothetical protein
MAPPGLPYESTPPPDETAPPVAQLQTRDEGAEGFESRYDKYESEAVGGGEGEGSAPQEAMDIDPLDRPLDDLIQQGSSSSSGPIPEHVKSLMGRMSQGKVYLLEESPAVVIHNEERVKGDPVSEHSGAEWKIYP